MPKILSSSQIVFPREIYEVPGGAARQLDGREVLDAEPPHHAVIRGRKQVQKVFEAESFRLSDSI